MKRTVWVWSGRRTGSTLLFGLVRNVLRSAGCESQSVSSSELEFPFSKTRVVKCHGEVSSREILHDKSPRDVVLCAVREPRFQLASLERVFRKDRDALKNYLTETAGVQTSALNLSSEVRVYVFQYDQPLILKIRSVEQALGVCLSAADRFKVAARCSSLAQRLFLAARFQRGDKFRNAEDSATRLHPNHIAPLLSRREASLLTDLSDEVAAVRASKRQLMMSDWIVVV